MLQIKFPSKNSRIYNEDLDSLYYIYKNRKNINTPFIEKILKINNYVDDNKTISIDNVVKFYKGKINNTFEILKDMNFDYKKLKQIITVYNKIDLINRKPDLVNNKNYLSAIKGQGIDLLRDNMIKIINHSTT